MCKTFHHLKSLLFRSFLRSPGRPVFRERRNGNADLYTVVSVPFLSGCWEPLSPSRGYCKPVHCHCSPEGAIPGREAAASLDKPSLWAPWLKHWDLLLGEPGTVTEGSRKWWCEFSSQVSVLPVVLRVSKRRGACRTRGTKLKIQSRHVAVRFSALWSPC